MSAVISPPSPSHSCGHWAFLIATIYGTDGHCYIELRKRERAERKGVIMEVRERERERDSPRILMEKHGLLGDKDRQPIKEHPVAAGYYGDRPPETMSAVITLLTRLPIFFVSLRQVLIRT